jgi:membrane dipeptidase
MISRRSILKGAVPSLGAPMLNRGRFSLFAQSQTGYSARTVDLVRRSTVIDMLGLLTLDYRKLLGWESDPCRFRQADFVRLKDSGTTVFHLAVGYNAGDIYTESLKDIIGWNAFIAAHGEQFHRIERVTHFKQAKALGKIGILIGEQNSAHFRTVEDIDRFYDLGQKSELARGVELAQARHELAAKHAAENFHGQEEVVPTWNPAAVVRGQAAGRDDELRHDLYSIT